MLETNDKKKKFRQIYIVLDIDVVKKSEKKTFGYLYYSLVYPLIIIG